MKTSKVSWSNRKNGPAKMNPWFKKCLESKLSKLEKSQVDLFYIRRTSPKLYKKADHHLPRGTRTAQRYGRKTNA